MTAKKLAMSARVICVCYINERVSCHCYVFFLFFFSCGLQLRTKALYNCIWFKTPNNILLPPWRPPCPSSRRKPLLHPPPGTVDCSWPKAAYSIFLLVLYIAASSHCLPCTVNIPIKCPWMITSRVSMNLLTIMLLSLYSTKNACRVRRARIVEIPLLHGAMPFQLPKSADFCNDQLAESLPGLSVISFLRLAFIVASSQQGLVRYTFGTKVILKTFWSVFYDILTFDCSINKLPLRER